MRADKDVRMIAGETPVLFTKAIGMFAMDMTLRSWNHTKEDKRRILRSSDKSRNSCLWFFDRLYPNSCQNPQLLWFQRRGYLQWHMSMSVISIMKSILPCQQWKLVISSQRYICSCFSLKQRLGHSGTGVSSLHHRTKRLALFLGHHSHSRILMTVFVLSHVLPDAGFYSLMAHSAKITLEVIWSGMTIVFKKFFLVRR